MRVLVCGDRKWTDYDVIARRIARINAGCPTIIQGGARGADTLAAIAARALGFPVEEFPADWAKHGKAAGPIRNRQMLDTRPELVIAFHNNLDASKGTKDCVTEARRRRIPVEVISSPAPAGISG